MRPGNIIFVLVLAAAIVSWIFVGPRLVSLYWQSGDLPKVASAAVVTLQATPFQKKIYALQIHVHGSLDGDARVELFRDGKRFKSADLHGDTDLEWNTDWYSADAEIHYQPKTARNGRLKIEYRFSSL